MNEAGRFPQIFGVSGLVLAVEMCLMQYVVCSPCGLYLEWEFWCDGLYEVGLGRDQQIRPPLREGG